MIILWCKIPLVLFRENIKIYSFFFFFYQFQSLRLFQTNWVFLGETGGKSRLCFGKTIWNRVFLSETSGKSRLCFWKMIDMKLSIQYQKISIYDHFHLNFHKEGSLYWIKSVLFENCHFHIISYLIVLYQYRIVSYQLLVPILWSRPCLVTTFFSVSPFA